MVHIIISSSVFGLEIVLDASGPMPARGLLLTEGAIDARSAHLLPRRRLAPALRPTTIFYTFRSGLAVPSL